MPIDNVAPYSGVRGHPSMNHHLRTALGALILTARMASAATPNAAALHASQFHYTPPASRLPPPRVLSGVAKPYSGRPIDVLTFHNDSNRTGWNPSETDLTPEAVKSGKFGLLTVLQVDDTVLAQPLVVAGFVMPDRSMHDLLIVATAHNSVYAFDANSYALLWHVNFGTPQSPNDVGCTNVSPDYGISSTPVINRTAANAGSLYVVTATEPQPGQLMSQLHALNLATGQDVLPPTTIAPAATLANGTTLRFDPVNQWNRTGLALYNGSVYVGIGSHCDNNANNSTGWLVRYNTANLSMGTAFHTIETPVPGSIELASVWMSGFAPAIDDKGQVLIATGNGAVAKPGRDWGESVLALLPSLNAVASSFTPSSWNALNSMDVDVGSGGVVALPKLKGQQAPPEAVSIGKSGNLYLLDRNHLGGLKTGDSRVLSILNIAPYNSGVWGGPTYMQNQFGPFLYVQAQGGVMQSFAVIDGSKPALKAVATGTSIAGFEGSAPVISSNGPDILSAVIWVIRHSAPLELEAYSGTLGAPIYSAQAGNWGSSLMNALISPTVANGRVYAGGLGTVMVFGLTE